MMNLLLIGLGGFLGAIGRYGLAGWVQSASNSSFFPIGTIVVNILGCLFIGIIGGLVESRQMFSPEIRLFIFIGFIGSFTTFSTLSFELFQLLRDQQYWLGFLYSASQFILGFIAVWLGFIITRNV